ncbi:MAG: PEP-CTERM sorting domain-containing protein [Planctomycetales bacterium]|nr:PEP-CTERM sorting domain-containing protein [Planctomycetales bacterium]
MSSYTAGPVPVPLPVLHIDQATGDVSIENPAGSSLSITGYTITSAAGSLDAGSFDSIAPASGFSVTTAIANEITESGTGAAISGGGALSLGAAWFKTPTRDLTFNYTLSGGTTAEGAIVYEGDAISRSDLNGDGSIDSADFATFVANHAKPLGVSDTIQSYLLGDLDGDLDNDRADFVLFKADFIAANGAAAFAALAGSVPEPTSFALLSLACLGGLRRRRNG